MRCLRLLIALVAGPTLLILMTSPASAQLTPHNAAETNAVELKAPEAPWYTPQLAAAARAAAEQGKAVRVPDRVGLPTGALPFTGIRPGSWMISPAGCTMSFVFGSKGNYHIGTAGHCTDVGDEVVIVAAPGVLMNIGTTVKSVDNGIGDDFALVAVRPRMQKHVNPSMAYFGGPTAAGDPRFGDLVEHVGHGLVIGTGGTPRAGAVVYRGRGEKPSSNAVGWVGAASPGDSGSPVRTVSGAGAGTLTHLVVVGKYVPADIVGTSIKRMREIARRPLATAPNLPDLAR